MKNRIIRERFTALLTLSRRTLPSPSAVNKVSFLLERYGPAFRATETSLAALYQQHPAPDGVEEGKLPESLLEARQAFNNTVLDQDTPVKKVPDHMRLRQDDMPKVLNGERGAENAAGLAEIRYKLGGLYVKTGDEIVNDEPDGEETE